MPIRPARVLLVGRQSRPLQALLNNAFGVQVNQLCRPTCGWPRIAQSGDVPRQTERLQPADQCAGVNHFGLFESMNDDAHSRPDANQPDRHLQLDPRPVTPAQGAAPRACVVNIGSTFARSANAGFSGLLCEQVRPARAFSQALRRSWPIPVSGCSTSRPRSHRPPR